MNSNSKMSANISLTQVKESGKKEALKSSGKLILFKSDSNSIILDEEIDALQKLAANQQISLIVKDDNNGLPKEVKTLPSIFFQNENGRSFYVGRYNNIPRLRNFIRTSKLVHPKDSLKNLNNVLVWKEGRADIIAHVKITKPQGKIPNSFDLNSFRNEVVNFLSKAMSKFDLVSQHQASKTSKQFYLNIYPYLDDDNLIYLTYEVFSQHNCIEPIIQQFDPIVKAVDYKVRLIAFAQIAKEIENDIQIVINSSSSAEAFSIVKNPISVIDWKDLNLNIESLNKEKEVRSNIPFSKSKKWIIQKTDENDEPFAIFSFLAPLDNYSGEIKVMNGSIELQNEKNLNNLQGSFKVNVADITMGAEDLDFQIKNKMLNQILFPEASFVFEEFHFENAVLKTNVQNEGKVEGIFEMQGVEIPLAVETIFLPKYINGQAVINATCTFQLPLFEHFKIKGPDGPSPAKDLLQFYMNFNLIENI